MNCVLSGGAGVAFVLDDKRVLMLRAGEEVSRVAHAHDFNRLLDDCEDSIFLEGVDLSTARTRLERAATVSDALAQALIVLDADAPADLRRESAEDLEPLLVTPEVREDLEAILYAAPFPDGTDGEGAVNAAAGFPHAVDLFSRLLAHQPTIFVVREAWDCLPEDLFPSPEARRSARAVAAREGLFLNLVREGATGGTGAAFHIVALQRREVVRWIPNARRLLSAWVAAVFGEPPPPPRLTDDDPDGDQPRARRGKRDAVSPGAVVSRNLGAKLLVDEALASFRKDLPQALREGQRAATDLLDKTWRRLLDIHGTKPEERPYLAKSAASIATLLNECGQGLLAVPVLENALERGAADAVVYDVLIDVHRKAGDLSRAQALFEQAVRTSLADAFTYAALVDAHGKVGDLSRAHALFDQAVRVSLADGVTYNALIDAYGKAGDLARAQALFDQAVRASLADEFTYNALIDAYGKAGDLARAQALFDQAVRASLADEVTYATLVNAYGKAGDLARAQALFDQAVRASLTNEATYAALVDAHGKAGDLARAQSIYDEANRLGLVDDVTRLVLLRALARSESSAAAERGLAVALAAPSTSSPAGQKVAATAAWIAARLGKTDWITRLPEQARTASVLFSFAIRTTDVDGALQLLTGMGTRGLAGALALRYRAVGRAKPGERRSLLRKLAAECRRQLERGTGLDAFSRIRIGSTEGRCLRDLGEAKEAVSRLGAVDAWQPTDRVMRAALLADAGKSHLVAGIEANDVAEAMQGATEIAQAWNFARIEDAPFALYSPTTIWTLADALAGYAMADEEFGKPGGRALVSRLEPLLAEGARDGRQAIEVVTSWDLPDELQRSAQAGIKVLERLKRTHRSPGVLAPH